MRDLLLNKQLFGLISIALTFIGYGPYFYSILKRRTRPHIFTWFVWVVIDGIAFAGQIASGSGAGAWSIGVSSVICLSIVVLCFKFGEKNIVRSDWVAFIVALGAIPVWSLTDDPLWALVLVTSINSVAGYPTLRKTYADPQSENLFSWSVHSIKGLIVFFAIETYSFATVIFPSAVILMNLSVVAIMLWRRRKIRALQTPPFM